MSLFSHGTIVDNSLRHSHPSQGFAAAGSNSKWGDVEAQGSADRARAQVLSDLSTIEPSLEKIIGANIGAVVRGLASCDEITPKQMKRLSEFAECGVEIDYSKIDLDVNLSESFAKGDYKAVLKAVSNASTCLKDLVEIYQIVEGS